MSAVAEWLLALCADLTPGSAICLAIAAFAAPVSPYSVLVGASPADFDPRPALARLVESGRLDRLLIAVANSRYEPRHAAPRRPLLSRLTAPEGAAR